MGHQQQKEHYGETWKNPCSRLKPDVDISWLGAIEAPCEPSARQWSCFNIWDMFPSSSTRFFFLPCPFTHIVLQFTHHDYAGKLPAIYCNYVKYQFGMVWMMMVGKRKENGKIEINIAAANAIINAMQWVEKVSNFQTLCLALSHIGNNVMSVVFWHRDIQSCNMYCTFRHLQPLYV